MSTTSPEHDGHWLTIDGRRWRATDPSIPQALRQELVNELMSARRAVRCAADDRPAMAEARHRVLLAKVALGERGEPWWDQTSDGVRTRLEAAILTFAGHRHPGTTCPSDAARAVGGTQWRRLMGVARSVASSLAADGEIQILQRGVPVDVAQPGPVRLKLGDINRGARRARREEAGA